jgi:hypothetical protein
LVVAAVAVLVFFLGGLITESAKETTLADHFNVTAGEEQFLCLGSNLLLMKVFLFVLILVSFVNGDSTNLLLLLTPPAARPDLSCHRCCCCCPCCPCCCLSSIEYKSNWQKE